MTDKAISINQPWAWLIVNGFKPLENRSWPTKFRGKVLIHAGLKIDHNFDWLWAGALVNKIIPRTEDMLKGGIVGEAEVIDCISESRNPWFFGPYAFVLDKPVAYDALIPCKGALGFFEPDYNSRYKPKTAPLVSFDDIQQQMDFNNQIMRNEYGEDDR